MKVILLGLEFYINNLGCEALSYSFAKELYELAKEQGEQLELVTVVFADQHTAYIPGTDQAIRNLKIRYKSKAFWCDLKREVRSSDLIVDFTMGDSFSDIYGKKRFVLDAFIKTLCIRTGVPFVLGPQTYGPYYHKDVKRWASWILKKAKIVYSRDSKSKELAENISKRKVILTTDVAFALPYEKKEIGEPNKIKVGFNPSGLLWGGGYTNNNQFHLKLDYQQYCMKICELLSADDRYELYLIPHVGTADCSNCGMENDLAVCQILHEKYPKMKVLKGFETPMDIKGYLAAMDVFIGSRMHATIGAFSSGVATIPVSYSRKFEGLYDSLNYNYLIHAVSMTTEDAVKKTMEYVSEYQILKQNVKRSMQLVQKKQKLFRDSFQKVIFS